MARTRAKRKLTFRPGLAEFARSSGVSLSHARRVVIGERESRSLLKKYRAWSRLQRHQKAFRRVAATLPALAQHISADAAFLTRQAEATPKS